MVLTAFDIGNIKITASADGVSISFRTGQDVHLSTILLAPLECRNLGARMAEAADLAEQFHKEKQVH